MLTRLGFPTIGRHRPFVTAIGIDALGGGVWMPVSVLYFLAVADLSLPRVGAAVSVAVLISLPFAFWVGQAVDRLGAKNVLQLGNVLGAVGFASYPLVHGFAQVTLVVAITSLGRTAFFGSFSPVVAAMSEPGERELWFGFLGALRNAGFAVGGTAAGIAVTIGTANAFHAVALVNALSYAVAFALMVRVRVREPHRAAGARAGGWRDVAQDRGYRWLVGANFCYAMGSVALTLLMPVYVVRALGLPGWVAGAVYVINTVLIGVGQGLVVRRMTGALRWRIVVLSAGLMLVGFVLLYVAGELGVRVAVVVVLVAAVVYTLGEMVGGPVLMALAAESPPAHLRGRFLATYQLTWNTSAALAPALYLWLLDHGHLAAWGSLSLIVVAGAVCCLPMRRQMPLAAQPVTNAAVVAS